ncbi:MAG TPA: hypothetical protein VFP52_17915 [Myxococcales bacterium]|jgi:uncharacterized membrane protein YccC|nr:hypothetical protein [Myxococcales bacterium]
MQKLILISIIAVTVVVPALASRDPNPRRALKKLVVGTVLGIAAYVISLLFIYPRLF